MLLLAYSAADLTVLSLRPMMIPQDKPPQKPVKQNLERRLTSADYRTITNRNLMNSDGVIPETLAEKNKGQDLGADGPAVASNLPLDLLGTIVHYDPNKSVASIQIKTKNQTQAFQVGDEIPNMAKILKVERQKVILRNTQLNRKEFIEIPKDFKMSFGTASKKTSTGPIESAGKFNFSIKRDEVLKQSSNLNDFLKKARVDPFYGPNGVEGFQMKWIQPGSIIENLGFKVGDVIKGVNGEEIKDPRAAMEAYNTLKNSRDVRVNIIRDGREEELNYSVTE